jgi:hypothetical protein
VKSPLVLVAVLSAALLLAAGPTAVAASDTGHATVHDKVGDAPSTIDITRVRVAKTSRTVTITLHVRRLSKAVGADFSVFGGYGTFDGKPFPNVWVETWTDAQHHVRHAMYEGEDGLDTGCRGLAVHWNTRARTVTVRSPLTCGFGAWFGRSFSAESRFAGDTRGHDNVRLFRVH